MIGIALVWRRETVRDINKRCHMKFHEAAPSASVEPRTVMRSICPECQDLMVAATMSQHVDQNVVRHFWACESCGYEFRTIVHLPTLAARNCCAA